ncbi:Phosphoserine aminotransferase [Bienertia sinuspersici]
MGETKVSKTSQATDRNQHRKLIDPSCRKFFLQAPQRLQNFFKAHLGGLGKKGGKKGETEEVHILQQVVKKEQRSSTDWEADLQKQLQLWRANPYWSEIPPEIDVTVPKGSLCNLRVKFDVGLPPDAVYDIVTDPDSKRVFKNIKEVISRKVLIDEGHRQVVDVEQAAIWKFLWLSGTILVRVLVEQNREDHSMKFKQINDGFMKKFEGCWRLEPIFVDEKICSPFKPKTISEYHSCTGGKGRIGSRVVLDQLLQPAIVPPPPISWYLRGITSKTSEALMNYLLEEVARIKGVSQTSGQSGDDNSVQEITNEMKVDEVHDIKKRWALRRRKALHCRVK